MISITGTAPKPWVRYMDHTIKVEEVETFTEQIQVKQSEWQHQRIQGNP